MALSRVLRSTRRCANFAKRSFATGEEPNPWEALEVEGAAHQPPLQLFGVPARFATAAYRQASLAGELDQVEKDLKTINGLLAGEENLKHFLSDPTTPKEEKVDCLNVLSKEYKFAEVTSSLLNVTVESGKIKHLAKITEAFNKYMSAKRGDVVSIVTSATALSKKEEKAVRSALEARLTKGQTLILEAKVDPKLIGGLVVEFGDELADLSVSTSLEDIGEALAAPGE